MFDLVLRTSSLHKLGEKFKVWHEKRFNLKSTIYLIEFIMTNQVQLSIKSSVWKFLQNQQPIYRKGFCQTIIFFENCGKLKNLISLDKKITSISQDMNTSVQYRLN